MKTSQMILRELEKKIERFRKAVTQHNKKKKRGPKDYARLLRLAVKIGG